VPIAERHSPLGCFAVPEACGAASGLVSSIASRGRPWVDGQATVHRYAQAQEFLAKQRLFVHWILPTRKRDCNKILLTRVVVRDGNGRRKTTTFTFTFFFIRNESGTVFSETKTAPVFRLFRKRKYTVENTSITVETYQNGI